MRAGLTSRLLLLLASLWGISAAPSLEPIPHPSAEAMEEAVRAREKTLRAELDRLLAEATDPGENLARAFGRLGRFYQAHQFLDAGAAALRNAVTLNADPRWSYALGVLYQSQGDLERAAEKFRRLAERFPRAAAPRIRLGWVELGRGRPGEAAEAFREARSLEGGTAAALEGLGRVDQLAGRHREAVDHFRRALKHQPGADRLHHRLGISLRALGDLEAAESRLEAAGSRPPGFPEPWLEPVVLDSLGSLQKQAARAMRAGRPGEAVAAMREVLSRRPGDPSSMRGLAAALLETGETGQALRLYRRAAATDPENPVAHAELGRALLLESGPDQALEPLRRAVELDPDNAGIRIVLARALLEQGRSGEALEHSRRATELDPASAEARRQAVRILTELGRFEEARIQLETLVGTEQAEPSDLLNLASLHLRTAEPDRAAAVLERVVREGPASPAAARAHLILGSLRLQAGVPEEAVPHLRSALEIDPELPDLRFKLGLALSSAGRPEEAIPVLEDLLRKNPDPLGAELLAMALASTGRTGEAASLQERILAAAERGGAPEELLQRLRRNLERYREGRPPDRLP